ncbi:hypothetical protein M747DRAFT_326567 [Aspergillus niger ATCC 13496]|uniref:Uncharacterized protein n=3 Tax=Aspergillus niger TaxID=5061 RepID=A2QVQ7_ASPNC|nr:hypothetical protein An11g02300 [Aspergillus niger]RDH14831.1 hypothetical protein M747DRAFT_326567 [Aspergillus niger ATCC 13496]CAK40589.1 hypothetical protein An11g02300 [Aspergillus niger]
MWRGRDHAGLLGPKGSYQASQGPVELVVSDVERSARRFTLWSLAGKPANTVSLFASLAAGADTSAFNDPSVPLAGVCHEERGNSMDDALLSSRNLRSYILIWVHWPVKLMGEFSHSLTMGWEMLQYTLRVVDHIQEKGFTNSGVIKQLFIDNWLSLFEMTSIVRENPSTDEDFRGTPEGTPVEGKKKQSTFDRGS